MRITNTFMANSMVGQLNTLTARQYRLQNQAATGQRIQSPEDDPAAMQRVLDLRAQNSQLQQYLSNVSVLQDRAGIAFNSVKSLKSISDRAGEIAILADGVSSPQELQAYASEVNQLIQQAAQLGNTRYGDGYLFAGTDNAQPPFVVTTNSNGQVTGVTYQGNASVTQSEIEQGATLSVDVPGQNNSGTGARGLITDSRVGADFFNHLISLQNNLLAGNTAAIAATDRPALQKDEDNFIYQIAGNGAAQARLDASATALSTRSLSVSQLTSKDADADMTQVLMQLNQTQTAYQAALQSTAAILGTSLLDYVR